ncbi:saccharopine dehydrogenase [candidate division LCP-89 bacterium B3_LCP]|uniref:Saccharopine dehydrogenase n=1 Tax=candidate division LCP-89 bacterium B3_LCP TaxID=2012998 RepID=A0A532UXT6_UNCL8|nr:MAG: saccharopine dehydrogenase [candidate division LCP-89 bacterium B3_LCP]
MKKVLILGAGHVTKPLVDYLIDTCGYQVTMAARTVSKADKIIANRSLGKAVSWAADQEELLDRLVGEHDIVVNMIPKAHHVMVVCLCLKHGKHMVSTSYEIAPVKAFDKEAKDKQVLILNELGEDPGMDHMGTQILLEEIRAEGGRVVSLNSYGSGLPSFKYNNNPLGYKFSWEPKGVFLAARVPAVHLHEGKTIVVPGDQLFDNHWLVDIEGLGTFETYPNKDCTRYLEHFGLGEDVTFYRGLLRFSGYCNNMRSFIALDLLNDRDIYDFKSQTYRQFAASLINCDEGENVEHAFASFLKVDKNADIINRLRWIGIFKDRPISIDRGSKLDVLVDLMLKKMTYAPGETDMTIIHIEIIAEFPDHHREKRLATMVMDGIPNGDSAMSLAVGLPPAIATRFIFEGRIKASGVQMPPTLPELYKPLLEELTNYGFEFKRRTIKL